VKHIQNASLPRCSKRTLERYSEVGGYRRRRVFAAIKGDKVAKRLGIGIETAGEADGLQWEMLGSGKTLRQAYWDMAKRGEINDPAQCPFGPPETDPAPFKEAKAPEFNYRDYLKSPQWRQLRDKVVKRDGAICQGCLSARSEHVHHMTYSHIGKEFAFQLVALCEPCHTRYHGKA
jgi:hypothetical protein